MLTQLEIKNAAPKEKPYKLADGDGLHLLINPNGSKLWRLRYRFGGAEKMLSLGSFPEVGLADAREKRSQARKLLAQGIDPSQQRRADKVAAEVAAQNTFGAVAQEYLDKLKAEGAAESTLAKNRWLLLDLASELKDRPISAITSPELLIVLRRVEKSGRVETARRLRGVVGTVYRYAIATLRAQTDPSYALRGALGSPVVQHRAAITDEQAFGRLMVAVDEYDGWPTLRAALQFQALTMTRPGDVRHMKRAEVNFPRAVWSIPAERMKMRRAHDVPLSRQAILVLQSIWGIFDGDLVFPSIRSPRKPLSENAMNSALRRMGYDKTEMTAHGFRSSASTILNERGFNPDWIEAALAHQDEDEVRRAYNRTTFFEQRVGLMQDWAGIIDELKAGAAKRAVA